jgi:hypothetical protein
VLHHRILGTFRLTLQLLNPSWGVFRLTTPLGLQAIANCSKTGFHSHPVPGISVDCLKGSLGGHVVEILGADFTVVDLQTCNGEDMNCAN